MWWQNWLKGFLQPTLNTAVEFLRVGGYLILNIADFQQGNLNFPLEYESEDFIKHTKRMKLKQVYRMALAPAPGANREHHFNGGDVVPTTKNYCKISGALRKYEPIFVWQKVK